MGDQRLRLAVELHPLHDGPLDPEQPSPYRAVAHAVPRSLVPDLQTAQNLSGDGVLLIQQGLRAPTETTGEPEKATKAALGAAPGHPYVRRTRQTDPGGQTLFCRSVAMTANWCKHAPDF